MAAKIPESLLQKQVRAVLERQCVEEFAKLLPQLPRLHFTLVLFDYDAPAEHANVAYKTTLRMSALVGAFESLLEGWRNGRQRTVALKTSTGVPTLTTEEMRRLVRTITCPAGVGFLLLLGAGVLTSYASSAERSGVTKMLEDDLLPNWRVLAKEGGS